MADSGKGRLHSSLTPDDIERLGALATVIERLAAAQEWIGRANGLSSPLVGAEIAVLMEECKLIRMEAQARTENDPSTDGIGEVDHGSDTAKVLYDGGMGHPDVIAALPRIIKALKQADGESWAVGAFLDRWLEDREAGKAGLRDRVAALEWSPVGPGRHRRTLPPIQPWRDQAHVGSAGWAQWATFQLNLLAGYAASEAEAADRPAEVARFEADPR